LGTNNKLKTTHKIIKINMQKTKICMMIKCDYAKWLWIKNEKKDLNLMLKRFLETQVTN
jgi:hypothetical protein